MKLLVAIFISLFFTNTFILKKEEIPTTIHFNFDTNIHIEKGKITIKETDQIFEITSLEDFVIPLRKGKYTIIFTAENFAKIRISKKIKEKDHVFNISIIESRSLGIQSQFSEELVLFQLENGSANFINFGLGMQNFTDFKKKYGIGNKNQGCVISGNEGSDATKNNEIIAEYLDKKHCATWREDLPFLPFGLTEK